MGLPEIMTHVQGLVDGVAGASRCHLGLRRFPSPEFLLLAAQHPGSTRPDHHLWFLQCVGRPEERLGFAGNTRAFDLLLNGFRQCWDPTEDPEAVAVGTSMTSEVAFSAEVESICDALRNDAETHGGSLAVGADPPQAVVDAEPSVIQVTPEDLGAESEPEIIECHHAVITVTVRVEMGVVLA